MRQIERAPGGVIEFREFGSRSIAAKKAPSFIETLVAPVFQGRGRSRGRGLSYTTFLPDKRNRSQ
jgi:hypothetical protein